MTREDIDREAKDLAQHDPDLIPLVREILERVSGCGTALIGCSACRSSLQDLRALVGAVRAQGVQQGRLASVHRD